MSECGNVGIYLTNWIEWSDMTTLLTPSVPACLPDEFAYLAPRPVVPALLCLSVCLSTCSATLPGPA